MLTQTASLTNSYSQAAANFGLINRTYPTDEDFDAAGEKTQWQRFEAWVKHLNSECMATINVQYKVLFLGRHGQGFHNAAEDLYGTPAWNVSLPLRALNIPITSQVFLAANAPCQCYWAQQDGNGTAVWADSLPTPAGTREVLKANAYFKDRYDSEGMPHFESYYSSPLARCAITANLTFGNLELPLAHPFIPTVKEGFREGMSVQTCNRSSNKTFVAEMFPFYEFEDGFTEMDELWDASRSETDEGFSARAKAVLDDVFVSDDATWISVTAHTGAVAHLLGALNHRAFPLATGQIIPVLVKAEVVEPQPSPVFEAFEPFSPCDAPPVTSIAGQGCVCATATATATVTIAL